MTQDIDDVCCCSLYGDKLIGEIESCDPNVLTYEQELIIIENNKIKGK